MKSGTPVADEGRLQMIVADICACIEEGPAPLVLADRKLLSVNCVTIWRMTPDGTLHPVEILPGMLRYSLKEIPRLAQAGTRSETLSRGSRGLGAVASAA